MTRLDGKTMLDSDGKECLLCLSVAGTNNHFFGEYYWFFYAGGALLLCTFLLYLFLCQRAGRKSLTLESRETGLRRKLWRLLGVTPRAYHLMSPLWHRMGHV